MACGNSRKMGISIFTYAIQQPVRAPSLPDKLHLINKGGSTVKIDIQIQWQAIEYEYSTENFA